MKSKLPKLLSFLPAIILLSYVFVLAGKEAVKSQVSLSVLKQTNAIASSHFKTNASASKTKPVNKYQDYNRYINASIILALWLFIGLLIALFILLKVREFELLFAYGAAIATMVGAFILWQKLPDVDFAASTQGFGFLPESQTDFAVAFKLFGLELSESTIVKILSAIPVFFTLLMFWRIGEK